MFRSVEEEYTKDGVTIKNYYNNPEGTFTFRRPDSTMYLAVIMTLRFVGGLMQMILNVLAQKERF